MRDRMDLLPPALRSLRELPIPGGVIVELRTFCTYHGPQDAAFCAACDDAHGINRAALANAQRIRDLANELRALGVDVGPIKSLGDEDPAPNEGKPVMSVAEQRRELLEKLAELGVSPSETG